LPLPAFNPNGVFLNIPYDDEFRQLYIAYIVGLYQLGLEPYIAAAIPGNEPRLSKIRGLIRSCRYSIHDLSRVELSPHGLETPRFNMPLELGMTMTWADLKEDLHVWFVMESTPHRLDQTTSDLGGIDPNIHHGTVEGLLSELRNAFVHQNAPPVGKMIEAYRLVESNLQIILTDAGTVDLFAASIFKELCFAALKAARFTAGSDI
jgi:hypothetical protein